MSPSPGTTSKRPDSTLPSMMPSSDTPTAPPPWALGGGGPSPGECRTAVSTVTWPSDWWPSSWCWWSSDEVGLADRLDGGGLAAPGDGSAGRGSAAGRVDAHGALPPGRPGWPPGSPTPPRPPEAGSPRADRVRRDEL